MTIVYSDERRADLIGRSPEGLREFTEKIPIAKLQPVLDKLPPIKGGFRPGKDVAVRLQQFFGRITKWDEDDWQLMAEIWVLWMEVHPDIGKSLGVSSRAQLDSLVNDMLSTPEVLQKTVLRLVQCSRRFGMSQEMIRQWYVQGPFPLDPMVEETLSLAPTEEELSFPRRLSTIEQKLVAVDKQFRDELRTLQEESRAFSKGLKEDIPGRLKSIEAQDKMLGNRLSQVEAGVIALNQSLGVVGNEKKSLRAEVNQLFQEIPSIRQQVARLSDHIESMMARSEDSGLAEEVLSAKKSVCRLETELETLKETGIAVHSSLARVHDRIEELNAAVESIQTELVNTTAQLSSMTNSRQESVVLLQREERQGHLRMRHTCLPQPAILSDVPSSIALLTKNLNNVGVTLPSAQRLAVEVVGALLAGQLVTFDGSFGFQVAERCAWSLAADAVYHIRIPIGLLEGNSLEAYLNECIIAAATAPSTTVVILEGINRSALEIYGDALRQFVAERVLQLRHDGRSLLLLATLVEGPATLPSGKGILELGPIFSTDALGWMDRPAGACNPGTVDRECWLSGMYLPDVSTDWAEDSVPQWLIREGGPLWKRGLFTAYAYLSEFGSHLMSRNESPSSLVGFGWLVPMALALRPDLVNEVLVDVTVDQRVKGILPGSD